VEFHDTLYEGYSSLIWNDSHSIKNAPFMGILFGDFSTHIYIKKDKKGKSIRNYEAAVAEIIKAGIKFVQLVKKRFHLQWNLFLM
jgi:hypothetical protein